MSSSIAEKSLLGSDASSERSTSVDMSAPDFPAKQSGCQRRKLVLAVVKWSLTLLFMAVVIYHIFDINHQVSELRDEVRELRRTGCVRGDAAGEDSIATSAQGGHSRSPLKVIDQQLQEQTAGDEQGWDERTGPFEDESGSSGESSSSFFDMEDGEEDNVPLDPDVYESPYGGADDSGGNIMGRQSLSSAGRKKRGTKKITCSFTADSKNKLHMNERRCRKALENYVESKIGDASPIAALHLEGHVNVADMTSLHQDPNRFRELPNKNGKMFAQGFVPNQAKMAFWSKPDWLENNTKTTQTFDFNPSDGSVTVKQSGIYYVYAQVTFHDTKAHLGYHVKKRPANGGPPEDVVSCVTGVDAVSPGEPKDTAKFKTCPSQGLVALQVGDNVSVQAADQFSKIATTNNGFTNWGLIRIG